jgi:hypothetical protein
MIVVGILSVVTSNFVNSTNYITDSGKYVAEYNKFNMFFIEDVKNNTSASIPIAQDTYINFFDGTGYQFKDNAIYRNGVKICKNIEDCKFTVVYLEEEKKYIVNVNLKIKGSNTYETENSYVLRYW